MAESRLEGSLGFGLLDLPQGCRLATVLVKAVFLVIKLYLPLNYVVNKPSTPAFWLERHRLLTGAWRAAGWQGR